MKTEIVLIIALLVFFAIAIKVNNYLQNKITLIQMQNQEGPPTTTPCRRHHHLQQRGLLDSAQNGPLGHQQVAGTTSQRGHPRGRCIRKR